MTNKLYNIHRMTFVSFAFYGKSTDTEQMATNTILGCEIYKIQRKQLKKFRGELIMRWKRSRQRSRMFWFMDRFLVPIWRHQLSFNLNLWINGADVNEQIAKIFNSNQNLDLKD